MRAIWRRTVLRFSSDHQCWKDVQVESKLSLVMSRICYESSSLTLPVWCCQAAAQRQQITKGQNHNECSMIQRVLSDHPTAASCWCISCSYWYSSNGHYEYHRYPDTSSSSLPHHYTLQEYDDRDDSFSHFLLLFVVVVVIIVVVIVFIHQGIILTRWGWSEIIWMIVVIVDHDRHDHQSSSSSGHHLVWWLRLFMDIREEYSYIRISTYGGETDEGQTRRLSVETKGDQILRWTGFGWRWSL